VADDKQRVIVGVSGATGLVYAVRALEVLRSLDVETHLVMTKPAQLMRSYESALSREDLEALADVVYPGTDVGAPISSGRSRRWGW
jgi:4-hydroxy-3-polyprenylbenzoate decarboxylase